jgi:N-acetylneuraminate synthase
MEPEEMKQLVIETERAWKSLGRINYGPTEDESKSMQFRRSLYITEDLEQGDVLTKKNLRSIRPGNGLPVKYINKLLGMHVNRKIPKGTPMSWQFVG